MAFKQKPVKKLAVIHDYNQHMGGVDQNDAQLEHYSPLRKSYKWTTKVFFHYLMRRYLTLYGTWLPYGNLKNSGLQNSTENVLFRINDTI